jgi:hypothetical protein
VDGVITVEDEEGNPHSLGEPLASAIFVHSTSAQQLRGTTQRVPTPKNTARQNFASSGAYSLGATPLSVPSTGTRFRGVL